MHRIYRYKPIVPANQKQFEQVIPVFYKSRNHSSTNEYYRINNAVVYKNFCAKNKAAKLACLRSVPRPPSAVPLCASRCSAHCAFAKSVATRHGSNKRHTRLRKLLRSTRSPKKARKIPSSGRLVSLFSVHGMLPFFRCLVCFFVQV